MRVRSGWTNNGRAHQRIAFVRKVKVVVAISDAALRERVVAALRVHPDLDVAAVAHPQDLVQRQGGGVAVLWQAHVARRTSQEYELLMQLRRQWVLVAVYDQEHLLEASSLFDIIDGWIPLEATAETPELLTLAQEGLAIMPHLPDPRLGLDSVRRTRLADLPPLAVRALTELPRGLTNREIADELEVPVEQISTLLRHSMERLCLRSRLETAVFVARTLHDRSPDRRAQ